MGYKISNIRKVLQGAVATCRPDWLEDIHEGKWNVLNLSCLVTND